MKPKTSLTEDINTIFNTEKVPTVLAEKVRSKLQEASSIDKDCVSGEWLKGAEAYGLATRRFLESRLPSIADAFLQEWWSELSFRQYQERKWFPNAYPAYLLCQVFLSVGDLGIAFRWALLAYAHDILSKQDKGAAYQILHATFGISTKDIAALKSVGEICRKDIEENGNDWGRICGFPEEVLRRFIAEKGQSLYTTHIAHHNTKSDFPIAIGYLNSLIDQLNANSSDKKGKRLEELAFYLMSLLPGCVPKRGVLDQVNAFETDLLVSNLHSSSNMISDLFGRHILVECKNYNKAVGVSHVGYFLFRMRLTHCSFGIIFAPKGITGKQDREARTLIRRAFHEDGSVCIVIDLNDLRKLTSGSTSLYWLLLEKYEEFRFGKPKKAK